MSGAANLFPLCDYTARRHASGRARPSHIWRPRPGYIVRELSAEAQTFFAGTPIGRRLIAEFGNVPRNEVLICQLARTLRASCCTFLMASVAAAATVEIERSQSQFQQPERLSADCSEGRRASPQQQNMRR
jgi:hypothetical protein